MGHGPETCWAKARHAPLQREVADGNRNQVALIDGDDQGSSSEDDSSSSDDEHDRNGFHVILDDQEVEEKFMAVKRNADGQALPKNARTGLFDPMPVENLLNPATQPQKKSVAEIKRVLGKRNHPKRLPTDARRCRWDRSRSMMLYLL